ncbi:MAG: hypothetical protein HY898_27460 [Deltaproteobacteria bacterium]|nr:hypothetical protein [Deltaproteobacteria bacterium]
MPGALATVSGALASGAAGLGGALSGDAGGNDDAEVDADVGAARGLWHPPRTANIESNESDRSRAEILSLRCAAEIGEELIELLAAAHEASTSARERLLYSGRQSVACACFR